MGWGSWSCFAVRCFRLSLPLFGKLSFSSLVSCDMATITSSLPAESDNISISWRVLVTTSKHPTLPRLTRLLWVSVSYQPTVLQEELCNACAPLTACRKGLKPVVPSAVLRMSRRLKKSLFRRQLRRSPILDGASAPHILHLQLVSLQSLHCAHC